MLIIPSSIPIDYSAHRQKFQLSKSSSHKSLLSFNVEYSLQRHCKNFSLFFVAKNNLHIYIYIGQLPRFPWNWIPHGTTMANQTRNEEGQTISMEDGRNLLVQSPIGIDPRLAFLDKAASPVPVYLRLGYTFVFVHAGHLLLEFACTRADEIYTALTPSRKRGHPSGARTLTCL